MNDQVEQSTKYKAEVANDNAAVTILCPKCRKGKITRTGRERAYGTVKECPNCGFKIPTEE